MRKHGGAFPFGRARLDFLHRAGDGVVMSAMSILENFRLVVFRTVASQLSFRKAAEELYLTQPAVSLQIKALEEDLGVQLFDRSGSQIRMTAAGEVLFNYAERVNALLAEAEQKIAASGGEQAGQLSLGASTTIVQYLLPNLLAEFRKLHPRVTLSVVSGNTEQMVDAVGQHRVSIACIEGPSRSRDVRVEPFLEDELVLIAPSAHEWAEQVKLPLSEISNSPLMMRERGSGTRDVIERELERHGIRRRTLQIVMELDSTEAIKSAVEAGLGAGFVSRWALAKDARLGRAFKIVEIEGFRIRRDFYVAHKAGPEPQGLAQEFRRFLLAHSAAWQAKREVTSSELKRSHKKNK